MGALKVPKSLLSGHGDSTEAMLLLPLTVPLLFTPQPLSEQLQRGDE